MSEEKHAENGTFGALHCAIFRTPSLRKSLGIHRFFGSRKDRTTGILHAMFIGACGPPEKLRPHFGAVLERSAHDRESRLLCDPRSTTHRNSHRSFSWFLTVLRL